MSKRLFLGIPVPLHVSNILRDRSISFGSNEIRLVTPEKYHVTVCFLGDVPEERLPALNQLLKSLFGNHPDISLSWNGIGLSPSKTMIWALFEQNSSWRRLIQRVQTEMHPFLSRDEVPQEQIPHITLARSKKGLQNPKEQIHLGPLKGTSIILYESILYPDGSEYRPLYSYELSHA